MHRVSSMDTALRSHVSKLDGMTKIDLVMRHGRINESIKEDVTSYEARHQAEQSSLNEHAIR